MTADDRARDRRGTQDLGLLLLRLGVGALLIAHGLQKAFGLWGGPGFDGFEKSLTDMGFQHADILTYVAAGGQIAAGVLLVLGLFTPVAAAGALAYLVTGYWRRPWRPTKSQVAVRSSPTATSTRSSWSAWSRRSS